MAGKSQHQLKKDKERFLVALEKSLGVITTACKMANIRRSTYYQWYNDDEEFKRQVQDVDNVTLDFAESALHKQINEGNASSTIFFLKTRGKRRGYVEKQEIEHSGEISGCPVINFADTTKKKDDIQ